MAIDHAAHFPAGTSGNAPRQALSPKRNFQIPKKTVNVV
jgi:hypothetical protein